MCLQILKDDLRRVLDDPGAVIASVEAGSLHELPSTVLGSLKEDLQRVIGKMEKLKQSSLK